MKFDIRNKDKDQINKILSDAWLNIIVDESTLFNPLMNIPEECREKEHLYILWLMSQPEYFSFLCKEILNIDTPPFQNVILSELYGRKFPMLVGSRGLGKTFILAVYSIIRCLTIPNRQVVIAGAGFRQSKLLFDYIVRIWNNAPLLRDWVGGVNNNGPKFGTDTYKFTLGDSTILAIPIGDGRTIRGIRANDLIIDEFHSHSEEIFENVLSGFAAVSQKPIDKIQLEAAKNFAKKFNIKMEEASIMEEKSNQIILSGTAYYHFNHFFKYWSNWKNYIKSKGDPEKLKAIFGDKVPDGFDYNHYSIMRIPASFLPDGYMDKGNLARSKATLHKSLYDMEFEAVFSEDSEGFFKATLINSCVSNVKNGISKEGYDIIQFDPRLHGDPNLQYVMAVDPASENDNFAITMIEIHPNHRRIVYCWTTNSKDFKEKRTKGEIQETDFYGYCARHIRNLMKKFNVCRIAIDSQGGGKAVYEALHDKNRLEPGEILIWEIIEEKQKDSDGEDGLHIVELVNFAKSEYTSESNHGMKKDFEDKILLFPNYNPAILSLFIEEIKEDGFSSGSIAIQMEDCITEIEELKKELSQIVVTSTATGRERWDTPDVKISGAEKGKMRKDRYSSLLMCNMSARKIFFSKEINHELSVGGFAHMYLSSKKEEKNNNFTGPAWAVNKLNDLY